MHRRAKNVQNNNFWSKKSPLARNPIFNLKILTQKSFFSGTDQAKTMEAAFMVCLMHFVKTKTLSGP
jgi:hypothetical protein